MSDYREMLDTAADSIGIDVTSEKPVIDPEHGTRLDDEDLVAAIQAAHGITPDAWERMPRGEQVAMQEAWVAPMPKF